MVAIPRTCERGPAVSVRCSAYSGIAIPGALRRSLLVRAGALVCFCVFLGTPKHAQADCGALNLVKPDRYQLDNARPVFSWRPVPGASRYLLHLESRVPEGRVLFSSETYVEGTEWTPPTPLATDLASVRLRIVPVCGDENRTPSTDRPTPPFRFLIDVTSTCRLAAMPIVSVSPGALEAHWPAVIGASEYEIVVRSAIDGAVVATTQAVQAQARLGDLPSGVGVLSVRPRCGVTSGSYRSIVVSVP